MTSSLEPNSILINFSFHRMCWRSYIHSKKIITFFNFLVWFQAPANMSAQMLPLSILSSWRQTSSQFKSLPCGTWQISASRGSSLIVSLSTITQHVVTSSTTEKTDTNSPPSPSLKPLKGCFPWLWRSSWLCRTLCDDKNAFVDAAKPLLRPLFWGSFQSPALN